MRTVKASDGGVCGVDGLHDDALEWFVTMDIIERLNEVFKAEFEVAHSMDMNPMDTANHRYATTCREAAAEIKRLREQVEILEAEIRVMRKLPAAVNAAVDAVIAADGQT